MSKEPKPATECPECNAPRLVHKFTSALASFCYKCGYKYEKPCKGEQKMDWKELEHLSELHCGNKLSPFGEENFAILLQQTENENEHPDNYEDECHCQLCMSYAD